MADNFDSHKTKPQYCSVKSQKNNKNPIFWYLVGISAVISFVVLFVMNFI